jgi:hypothetical protein
MPVVLELGRGKQDDHQFEASLCYIAHFGLKIPKKKKKKFCINLTKYKIIDLKLIKAEKDVHIFSLESCLNYCPFEFFFTGSRFNFSLQSGNEIEFEWKVGLC